MNKEEIVRKALEAQEYRKAGRLEQSVACYKEVVQMAPSWHEAWSNLGANLFELGRLNQALSCMEKAIELKQDDLQSWYNKGSIQARLKLFEEALRSYKRVLDLNPGYGAAWAEIGRVLLEQNRKREALAAFQQAARLGDETTRKFLEEKGLLGDPGDQVRIGFKNPEEGQQASCSACEGKSIGIGIPLRGRTCVGDPFITVKFTDLDRSYKICSQCFEETKLLFRTMLDRIEKTGTDSYIIRVT